MRALADRASLTLRALGALLLLHALFGGWSGAVDAFTAHPAITFPGIALVAIGERALVRMPSGRVLAPISSAAGMALVAFGAVQGGRAFDAAPTAVVLVFASGQIIAVLLDRGLDGSGGRAARLVSIGVMAHVVRGLDIGGRTLWEWQLLPSTPRWLVALGLVATAGVALALERLLAAVVRSLSLHTSLATSLRDEVEEALPFTVSTLAPAPIATLIAPVAGVLALPMALLPVLINVLSLRRYAEVGRTFRQTLRTLSSLTDKAGYTLADHAHRTAELTRLMARRLDLPDRDVRELEYAALLHDLGQVSLEEPIPDGATVLAAPADQRMIARTGADIIRHGSDFAAVADLVEQQAIQHRAVLEHEEQAPLSARILRVANAFDDLTGGRSDPRAVAAALERIHLGLGYDYDPEVVAVLEAVLAGESQAAHPQT